jgi:hypothetical protein
VGDTYRQQCDLISLLLFFKNKERRVKMPMTTKSTFHGKPRCVNFKVKIHGVRYDLKRSGCCIAFVIFPQSVQLITGVLPARTQFIVTVRFNDTDAMQLRKRALQTYTNFRFLLRIAGQIENTQIYREIFPAWRQGRIPPPKPC